MSRARSCTLRVRGALRTTEPFHAGCSRFDLETDLPLALNGQRHLYVPGTSLAGPMRAWMFARFGETPGVAALWGDAGERGASRIILDDAMVTGAAEIWDSVGINRELGAAMTGVKFDRAVLPAGTKLALDIEVELPIDSGLAAECRCLIGHLLQALKSGEIGFGSGRTRGFGTAALESESIVEEDWTSQKRVLEWLGNPDQRTVGVDRLVKAAVLTPRVPASLHVKIGWEPDGPVMVKAGGDGLAVDTLPMVSGTGDQVGLVIPGSSIKGTLRSQAERIVRTVTGASLSSADEEGPARHRRDMDLPLVRTLFGGPRIEHTTDPTIVGDAATVSTPWKGALAVSTCFAESIRGSSAKWQDLASATSDSDLERSIQALGAHDPGQPNLQSARHVGIDRWTGGAADRILFGAIEPFNIVWTPIRLRLDLAAIDATERDAAVALLLLLVRDLVEHRVAIGFGHNRGYGAVTITSAIATVGGDSPADDYAWLNGGNVADLATILPDHLVQLEAQWQAWIDGLSTKAPEEVLA